MPIIRASHVFLSLLLICVPRASYNFDQQSLTIRHKRIVASEDGGEEEIIGENNSVKTFADDDLVRGNDKLTPLADGRKEHRGVFIASLWNQMRAKGDASLFPHSLDPVKDQSLINLTRHNASRTFFLEDLNWPTLVSTSSASLINRTRAKRGGKNGDGKNNKHETERGRTGERGQGATGRTGSETSSNGRSHSTGGSGSGRSRSRSRSSSGGRHHEGWTSPF